MVSTSALLLGVPWALAFSEEQQVQEMEREMRMQQSANEVSWSPDMLLRACWGNEADDHVTAFDARRWATRREAGAIVVLLPDIDFRLLA